MTEQHTFETVPSRRLPGTLWGCKPPRGPLEEPTSVRNQCWRDDVRIDPRIRAVFNQFPFRVLSHDRIWIPELDGDLVAGGEALAPSTNLSITDERIVSNPDGNEISLSIMRPSPMTSATGVDDALPCVVYFHGGGMSHYSAFLNCFQTLGRLIASRGVVCVLPDFRNCDVPSRLGEQSGPFPAGLNDCVSTVTWVHENAASLSIDPARVVLAGESGGGNLTIATALRLRNKGALVSGVFVACPFTRGVLDPQDESYPSYLENAGIFMDYPLEVPEAFKYRLYGHPEAQGKSLHASKNVEAWPGYLTKEDLSPEQGGFPPCDVVVNEFDPLLDEGIAFYRTCLAAGVQVKCTTLNGTIHGIGTYLPGICPDITHSVIDLIEARAKRGRTANTGCQ